MDMDITSQSGGGNGQGAATADSTAPSLLQSEDFGVTGDATDAVSNTGIHSNDNNMESGDTTVKSEILGWDPRHSLNARAATVLYRGNLRTVDLTKVDWVERYFSPVVSGVKYDTITKIPYGKKISFRDIRIKLEEQGFFILLKENGIAVDKLRFYPRAGKPALMQWKEVLECNIWENLEGDGSLDRPYLVVMAPYEKRHFSPVIRLGANDFALNKPVLKIAYYRQRLSFGDIRTKLKKRNYDGYLTKFDLDFEDLRFSLHAGDPVLSWTKEEEWSVWDNVQRDGSYDNPHTLFMAYEQERYFCPVVSGLIQPNIIIEIHYGLDISFRDVRLELEDSGFNPFPADEGSGGPFVFTLSAGGPALSSKQESDSSQWSVWKYVQGDGSRDQPHLVYVEAEPWWMNISLTGWASRNNIVVH